MKRTKVFKSQQENKIKQSYFTMENQYFRISAYPEKKYNSSMKFLNCTTIYHFKRWKFRDRRYLKSELLLIPTNVDKTKTEPARTLHEWNQERCYCLQRWTCPQSVHHQSHNGQQYWHRLLEKSQYYIYRLTSVERGSWFALITSPCTCDICTVASIQGNEVFCYLHR